MPISLDLGSMVMVRFWAVPWANRPRSRSPFVRDMIGAKMIRTAGGMASCAGQAGEEERAPVDAALVAAGRLADQGAQAVLLHGLGELEGRRAVRGAHQHPHAARESRRLRLDQVPTNVVVVLRQAEGAPAGLDRAGAPVQERAIPRVEVRAVTGPPGAVRTRRAMRGDGEGKNSGKKTSKAWRLVPWTSRSLRR